jgi:hypothetical protein
MKMNMNITGATYEYRNKNGDLYKVVNRERGWGIMIWNAGFAAWMNGGEAVGRFRTKTEAAAEARRMAVEVAP